MPCNRLSVSISSRLLWGDRVHWIIWPLLVVDVIGVRQCVSPELILTVDTSCPFTIRANNDGKIILPGTMISRWFLA